MSDAPRLPSFCNRRRSIAPPVPTSPVVSQYARLFSVEQTATYCSCAKRQVRYWIARGLLHPVRLDRRLRIDRVEVDRLIERAMQRDLRPPPRASTPKRVDPFPPGGSASRSLTGSISREAAP